MDINAPDIIAMLYNRCSANLNFLNIAHAGAVCEIVLIHPYFLMENIN